MDVDRNILTNRQTWLYSRCTGFVYISRHLVYRMEITIENGSLLRSGHLHYIQQNWFTYYKKPNQTDLMSRF